jgi:hypothetical protein
VLAFLRRRRKFYNIAARLTIFRHPFLLAAALLWAASANALGERRPLNWRRAKKKPAVAAEEKGARAGPRLGARWSRKSREALWSLMEVRGSSSAAYNAEVPPVAMIDRAAAVEGDVAEAVFFRLVTEGEFKFDDDFWKLVPAGWGRQRLRAAYEQFAELPKTVWPSQPAYRQYRKGFLEGYRRICGHVGVKECRSFIAKLTYGYTEEQLREYAKKTLEEEAKQQRRDEVIQESDQDPRPLLWPRGFSIVPEMAELVKALRAAGFDVWSVGLAAQPELVVESGLWGVDPTRCLGIKQATERERLNGQLLEPIPIRVGAVDAAVSALGRRPALVVLSSTEMADLAIYAEGLRVLVDRGDLELRRRLGGGCVIQRPFRAAKR